MLDEFEHRKRLDMVAATWREVPRHQLRWRCSPVFVDAVEQWSIDRSLVLIGATGTGKTSACVRLVRRLCANAVQRGGEHILPARSLCWVDADDLTDSGARHDDDDARRLDRAARAQVLILDDVARHSNTIQRVLRARLRRQLPTVLTSGVRDERELVKALGGIAVMRHVLEATGVPGEVVIAKDIPR